MVILWQENFICRDQQMPFVEEAVAKQERKRTAKYS
jgi:hypothetical protein